MPHALDADFDALAGVRVFFGHQSIGDNILDGLRDLLADAGRQWPITALGGQSPSSGGMLHSRVGKNEQPVTKCDEFRHLIDEDLAGSVDIALLKFCYIDINERSDVGQLSAYYRSVIDDLARRHTTVTFVPVTAPLRHVPGGLGVWAREMMGRPNRGKLVNLKRHQFNDLLRQAYADRPVFDVAAAESTRPNGRREMFPMDGRARENLVGAYTDDGGHLNAVGRRGVAAALVRTLAQVARRRHEVGR